MTPTEMPLTLTHHRLHRILRAGACPILEISVTYPCLGTPEAAEGEASPAVARFNEAYRTMADRLTEWAAGTLFEAALADFNGAGVGAAYRFDRRVVACDMAGEMVTREDGEAFALTVTRTLRLNCRRGTMPERCLIATDRWSLPDLTLRPPRGRSISI